MGVSGAGKSTVGAALARRLGWAFLEGDDLQPSYNVAKMVAGRPLDDDDRAPWLEAVGAWIDLRAEAGEPGVAACSVLKRAYRDQLRRLRPQVAVVYLQGPACVVADRLRTRSHVYMPATLLSSQFSDLQPPAADEGALEVNIELALDDQIALILEWLVERGHTAMRV